MKRKKETDERGFGLGWREKRKEIAFTKSAEFKLCQCLLGGSGGELLRGKEK
jgi:hypothetical protein